jgi:hypothetical protein
MTALATALIYFGVFIALGLGVKVALARWGVQKDIDLTEIQAQAGPDRRPHRRFLLGAWRTED